MMRTDTVRAKVSHDTKVSAERVLKCLGLSMSEAINLLLVQIKLRRALPFDVAIPSIPNEETLAAMKEIGENKNLTTYDSPENLFKELGINVKNKKHKEV